MKIYNDLDLQGNNLLNVANMPQFMLDIKLLHARNIGQQGEVKPTYSEQNGWTDIDEYAEVTPVGTENPKEEGWYTRSGEAGSYVYTKTTDEEVVSGTTYYLRQWDEKYQALCYAYKTTSGVAVEAVSVASFLQEAEFKDGLSVNNDGEVRVLVDPSTGSTESGTKLLTVSPSGIKFNGTDLTAEQLAAIAWAIDKREDELQDEAEALFSVTTTASGGSGTTVVSTGSKQGVNYIADIQATATMTVTVTVKFNSVNVTPTNDAALQEAGWSTSSTGVYTKTVTGGNDTLVDDQMFTYTIPSTDPTYAGLTVSKKSSKKYVMAVYPIFYGFAATNDSGDLAEVMALTDETKLTRSTQKLTFNGSVVNNLNATAWYWALTHSASGASMWDAFGGEMLVLESSSAQFVSTQNSSITMTGYKLYISRTNAEALGTYSSAATGGINI